MMDDCWLMVVGGDAFSSADLPRSHQPKKHTERPPTHGD